MSRYVYEMSIEVIVEADNEEEALELAEEYSGVMVDTTYLQKGKLEYKLKEVEHELADDE